MFYNPLQKNHPKSLVIKFGGASTAVTNSFAKIAQLIQNRFENCARIVVVVSAMGGTTDKLIALAKEVHPNPPQREYDMLLSAGERISMALLAMALSLKQQKAHSLTGSQAGIITCNKHAEAKILEVRPHRVLSLIDNGKIAIVAGFQGVSRNGEITTLGRGGSDTSAVALGLAIGAERVEFYKDVPGIFSDDPKIHSEAQFYEKLTYDQALAIVAKGAKVLHPRAIALARKNQMPLIVRSFQEEEPARGKKTLIFEEKGIRPCTPIFEEECE